jgi:hypothetical protein
MVWPKKITGEKKITTNPSSTPIANRSSRTFLTSTSLRFDIANLNHLDRRKNRKPAWANVERWIASIVINPYQWGYAGHEIDRPPVGNQSPIASVTGPPVHSADSGGMCMSPCTSSALARWRPYSNPSLIGALPPNDLGPLDVLWPLMRRPPLECFTHRTNHPHHILAPHPHPQRQAH